MRTAPDADACCAGAVRRGYGIGTRIVEDFFARTNSGRCTDFRETAETLAKVRGAGGRDAAATAAAAADRARRQVGFKMFLGISPTVANWSSDSQAFSLIFDENPLTDFVELPESHSALLYSNILCGVVRGALEMVGGLPAGARLVRRDPNAVADRFSSRSRRSSFETRCVATTRRRCASRCSACCRTSCRPAMTSGSLGATAMAHAAVAERADARFVDVGWMAAGDAAAARQ